jgi:predicted phosphoribosyltransferase
VRIVNEAIVRKAHVSHRDLARVEHAERAELERQVTRYRGGRPKEPLRGRTAIVVDDGIATGATVWAACQTARLQGARRVVVAVGVAPPRWTVGLRDAADAMVCIGTPAPFYAVGEWYDDFDEVTDAEVTAFLGSDRRPTAEAPPPTTHRRAS